MNVDECATGGHNCDVNISVCADTTGSFTCTCGQGWESIDGGVTCFVDDECYVGVDDCNVAAQCTDMPGSFYCTCDIGFRGDGTFCDWVGYELPECPQGWELYNFHCYKPLAGLSTLDEAVSDCTAEHMDAFAAIPSTQVSASRHIMYPVPAVIATVSHCVYFRRWSRCISGT